MTDAAEPDASNDPLSAAPSAHSSAAWRDQSANVPNAEAPADGDLACPQCGYDLRGLTSGRCPECGQAIEAIYAASRLPWFHRRHRGRTRAYLATVWAVMVRPSLLRGELNVAVSLRDARRFSRVTAALVFLPALACVALAYLVTVGGFSNGLIRDPSQIDGPWWRMVLWDGLYPLMVGWIFVPAIVVFAAAASFGATRVLPWMVNRATLPMPRRARAAALAHYASGPLAVWGVGLLIGVGVGLVWQGRLSGSASPATMMNAIVASGIPGAAIGLAVVGLIAVVRSAGLYRHVFAGGVGRWMAGAMVLLAGWAVVVFFWLIALPWTMGVIWLLARGQG